MSIVTRGYGSYGDVALIATRGYGVVSEDEEEAAPPMEIQPSTNEFFLQFGLNTLFYRLFKRG